MLVIGMRSCGIANLAIDIIRGLVPAGSPLIDTTTPFSTLRPRNPEHPLNFRSAICMELRADLPQHMVEQAATIGDLVNLIAEHAAHPSDGYEI